MTRLSLAHNITFVVEMFEPHSPRRFIELPTITVSEISLLSRCVLIFASCVRRYGRNNPRCTPTTDIRLPHYQYHRE